MYFVSPWRPIYDPRPGIPSRKRYNRRKLDLRGDVILCYSHQRVPRCSYVIIMPVRLVVGRIVCALVQAFGSVL